MRCIWSVVLDERFYGNLGPEMLIQRRLKSISQERETDEDRGQENKRIGRCGQRSSITVTFVGLSVIADADFQYGHATIRSNVVVQVIFRNALEQGLVHLDLLCREFFAIP